MNKYLLENQIQSSKKGITYFKIRPNEDLVELTPFFKKLGWRKKNELTVNKSITTVNCLLVLVENIELSQLIQKIKKYPQTQLVFLKTNNTVKKKIYFELLEKKGFRLIFERKKINYFTNIGFTLKKISLDLALGDNQVQLILQASQRRIRKLPKKTTVDILSVKAPLLLVPERFDIAIKAHYARLYLDKLAPSWREYAYSEQAIRITGPGNDIKEYDGTGKSGIQQFLCEFHRLISATEPDKIPIVPVDNNWVAFDGSHRIAAAIATKRDIQVARIHNNSKSIAQSEFFKSTLNGHITCPDEILDEAAIEYCRLKSGLVLALIFPSVDSEIAAIRELEKVGKIVYKKNILLTPGEGAGLLRQAYLGHDWVENSGNTEGFINKIKACFPFTGLLRVVLLDSCKSSLIRSCKGRIRDFYNVGNHSIHIADGDDEVLRMARVLFNDNSIKLLGYLGTLPFFHKLLFDFRDWIERNSLDEELFCIDGSSVLSMLNLRECRDLDFIFHGSPEQLPLEPRLINCHNESSYYYNHSISDIIGDPRLHCWYMGIKFCTPSLILKMKQNRGEQKDFVDIKLLTKLKLEKSNINEKLKFQIVRSLAFFYVHIFKLKNYLKKLLRPLINKFRHLSKFK